MNHLFWPDRVQFAATDSPRESYPQSARQPSSCSLWNSTAPDPGTPTPSMIAIPELAKVHDRPALSVSGCVPPSPFRATASCPRRKAQPLPPRRRPAVQRVQWKRESCSPLATPDAPRGRPRRREGIAIVSSIVAVFIRQPLHHRRRRLYASTPQRRGRVHWPLQRVRSCRPRQSATNRR